MQICADRHFIFPRQIREILIILEEIEDLLHFRGHLQFAPGAVFYQVGEQGIYPLAVALAAVFTDKRRDFLRFDYPGSYGVVQIVVYVGYPVAQPHGHGLGAVAVLAVGVVEYAHAGLIAEV